MFSDRYRIVKIIALIAALTILLIHAGRARKDLTLARCKANPDFYDGKEVPIHLEAKVIKAAPGRLRIAQSDGPVDVWIPPHFNSIVPPGGRIQDLKPGQYLEARTVFHRERGGYLELKEIRIAALRKLKIIISLISSVVIMALLLVSLRWEKGGLVLKAD